CRSEGPATSRRSGIRCASLRTPYSFDRLTYPILNRSKKKFIGSRPTFWTGSKWDQCESSVIRIMSQEGRRKFSAATGNSHLRYTPHEDLCEDEAMGTAVGDESRASGSRPTIRDVAAAAGVS